MNNAVSAAVCKWGIGFGLASAYVIWLIQTSSSLGYARDEGFYFYAAARYQEWFQILVEAPARALEPAVLDYHWAVNREHPAFVKTLFALSHWLFHEQLGWFAEAGTAYRFVGMSMAGVALFIVYIWAQRLWGIWGGLVATGAFGLMPRVFFHAHLSCFDIPVATLWLATVFAYSRAVSDQRSRWALATGVLFGLLLNTKHNSWLLPPVLVAHWLFTGAYRGRELLSGASKALLCVAVIGPVLCYASWPWLWRDTWERWLEYVRFHLGHEYYNMEFLRQTYHKPPMPLAYAWVMTAATVPLTTLLLALIGAAFACKSIAKIWLLPRLPGRLQRWLQATSTSVAPAIEERLRSSCLLLWVLCVLASYAPWLLQTTPIFGGTKHWLTAYPFLALLAGAGFEALRIRLMSTLAEHPWRRALAPTLTATVLAPGLLMTVQSHPYGLSAYTPVVGGAAGGATLGLNRGFWGYTTGALQEHINESAPGGATLYLHDTARQSFSMLQRDRRIRRDIVPSLDIASSDMALYHHEPHMGRVEYQIWLDYGTLRPEAFGLFQGVPVVWMYRRPER